MPPNGFYIRKFEGRKWNIIKNAFLKRLRDSINVKSLLDWKRNLLKINLVA